MCKLFRAVERLGTVNMQHEDDARLRFLDIKIRQNKRKWYE